MRDDTSRKLLQLGVVSALVAVILAGAACTSEPAATISVEDYRTQLAAVCTTAAAAQTALVEPADASQVAAFARDVATLVGDEAEQARTLRPPDELDADHRAFVQNTSDQAARWTALAATPPDDAETFGTLRTEILQLTLGRDDLAAEMGVDACRRSAP